jgi:hypothetical protein
MRLVARTRLWFRRNGGAHRTPSTRVFGTVGRTEAVRVAGGPADGPLRACGLQQRDDFHSRYRQVGLIDLMWRDLAPAPGLGGNGMTP